jgi:hypothetical protein
VLQHSALPIIPHGHVIPDTEEDQFIHIFEYVFNLRTTSQPGRPVSNLWYQLSQEGITNLHDLNRRGGKAYVTSESVYGMHGFSSTNLRRRYYIPGNDLAALVSLLDMAEANWYYNNRQAIDWTYVDRSMLRHFTNVSLPYIRYNLDPSDPLYSVIFGGNHNPSRSSTPVRPVPTVLDRELMELRKGVKRDKTVYPKLEDDTPYFTWRGQMESQAHSHLIGKILDPTSYPIPAPGSQGSDVYNLLNGFLYTVMEYTLQTTKGKDLVLMFNPTRDGRQIWENLHEWYTKSATALSRISRLHSTIRAMHLTPSHTGSYLSFLILFDQRIREHNGMVPPPRQFSPQIKFEYLREACVSITEFSNVDTQVIIMNTQMHHFHVNGSHISGSANLTHYDSLLAMYKLIAERMDLNRTTKSVLKTNAHDIQTTPLDADVGDDDSVYSSYQTYAARTRPPRESSKEVPTTVALTKITWEKLSDEDKKGWDTVSRSGKSIIMQGMKAVDGQDTPSNSSSRSVSNANTEDPIESTTADSTFPHAQDSDIQPSSSINKAQSSTPKSHSPGSLPSILSHPDRKTTFKTNMTHVSPHTYRVSTHASSPFGSLIDRGANGGLAGGDMRVISVDPNRKLNITGIDNHQMVDLNVVTAGAFATSHRGPVILIFNQYANVREGRSIHSSLQLEHYKIDVHDKGIRAGGKQNLTTPDGFCFALDIVEGLAYLPMRPYTDTEYDSLPHIIMTSDAEWDCKVLDLKLSDKEDWHDKLTADPPVNHFDEYGRYLHRYRDNPIQSHLALDVNYLSYASLIQSLSCHLSRTHPAERDLDRLRPYFLFAKPEVIDKTYRHTTQWARRLPQHGNTIRNTFKSPFPMYNVHRRNEAVATDTIESTITAIDGVRGAQIFVGRETYVIDVFPITSKSEFRDTLEDVIRKRGAMNKLISDGGSNEVSEQVKTILRAFCIDDWQSEPRFQHQNMAERRWQQCKHSVHRVLDHTNAPPKAWFLCLQYVAYIMNRMSLPSLHDETPLFALDGQRPDISMLGHYLFWDEVYYSHYYHSETNPLTRTSEALGRFVGFSSHVGHPMTYIVFVVRTRRLVVRSRIRLVKDGERNVRADKLPDPKTGEVDINVHTVLAGLGVL